MDNVHISIVLHAIFNTYLKFDLEGLPSSASSSVLWLAHYFDGGTSTTTTMNLNRVTSDWTTSMTWSGQPSVTSISSVSKPEYDQWWGVDITSTYNNWRSGSYSNYGLRLDPLSTSNKFNTFRSSRYVTDDGLRPMLELTYSSPVSVPDSKIPLPGALSWKVTTETGGWDCVQNPQLVSHMWNNFFSIDFSPDNRDGNGDPQTQFSVGTSSTSSIPVIASADGKVAEIGTNPSADNGYYIVIDHGNDASLSTDFSTRYLHLKYSPSLSINDSVSQGDLLGFMGNTGSSTSMHLHFGTRYENSGASTSTVQYATNNGWLLRSYQTECSAGTPIRYYLSSNTAY